METTTRIYPIHSRKGDWAITVEGGGKRIKRYAAGRHDYAVTVGHLVTSGFQLITGPWAEETANARRELEDSIIAAGFHH